ncbi:hypothetical protein QJQ45_011661 [Haematococcus lacustris]|nr:hypothetical protein QJQ45_011661 [Haematococcus lacustris]
MDDELKYDEEEPSLTALYISSLPLHEAHKLLNEVTEPEHQVNIAALRALRTARVSAEVQRLRQRHNSSASTGSSVKPHLAQLHHQLEPDADADAIHMPAHQLFVTARVKSTRGTDTAQIQHMPKLSEVVMEPAISASAIPLLQQEEYEDTDHAKHAAAIAKVVEWDDGNQDDVSAEGSTPEQCRSVSHSVTFSNGEAKAAQPLKGMDQFTEQHQPKQADVTAPSTAAAARLRCSLSSSSSIAAAAVMTLAAASNELLEGEGLHATPDTLLSQLPQPSEDQPSQQPLSAPGSSEAVWSGTAAQHAHLLMLQQQVAMLQQYRLQAMHVVQQHAELVLQRISQLQPPSPTSHMAGQEAEPISAQIQATLQQLHQQVHTLATRMVELHPPGSPAQPLTASHLSGCGPLPTGDESHSSQAPCGVVSCWPHPRRHG